MIFSGVKLPDEIRIALEEDRLVIFAGTGVSIPPPSSLPDFNGLARQIIGSKDVQSGREDRVLGKSDRDGTDVHVAAAKILYNRETHPTALHKRILQIFGSASKVRVVTTNFDNHFTTVSQSIYHKNKVDEYYAPALPLGDDFRGIIYLHGSARVNPHAMVLTDKDFGAAYLTRGWARDFLVALFSRYTILFVGYSHNDVTIRYLARGLKSSASQASLDVDCLQRDARGSGAMGRSGHKCGAQYPIDPSCKENEHQPLTNFHRLGRNRPGVSSSTFKEGQSYRVSTLPPETETVSEYLEYCLRHPRLAEDFCGAIRHPAWIGWMHTKGYFAAFFTDTAIQSKDELQPYQGILLKWLSSSVRIKYPELLLEILETHKQRLTPLFSKFLAQSIWSDSKQSADIFFAVWVSILLSQGEETLSEFLWASLLKECRMPDHTGVALRLLQLLTTPKMRLRKSWDSSGATSSKPKSRL